MNKNMDQVKLIFKALVSNDQGFFYYAKTKQKIAIPHPSIGGQASAGQAPALRHKDF